MPREGAIAFRDIAGKLTVLRVTCDKCGRSASYRVHWLIMRYSIDAGLFDWSAQITAEAFRQLRRPVRREVPGPVEGGLGFPKLASLVHRLLDP